MFCILKGMHRGKVKNDKKLQNNQHPHLHILQVNFRTLMTKRKLENIQREKADHPQRNMNHIDIRLNKKQCMQEDNERYFK